MATHINGESEFRTLPLSERKVLTIRPTLNQARISAVSKPTAVFLGCFQGYSMPIWNDGANVEEELYYRLDVPKRWDGVTNPVVNLYTHIRGVEDVGDSYKIQFDYNAVHYDGDVITDTVYTDYDTGTVVLGGTAAFSTYLLSVELDATKLNYTDVIGGRLRRVATDGTEVSNEVGIMYLSVEFPIDKLYESWT